MLPICPLLHMAGNSDAIGNRLEREFCETLQTRLPPGWKLSARSIPMRMSPAPDFLSNLTGPKGERTRLAVEIKQHLEPQDARALR